MCSDLFQRKTGKLLHHLWVVASIDSKQIYYFLGLLTGELAQFFLGSRLRLMLFFDEPSLSLNFSLFSGTFGA
jgi:hypothetical protein